MAKKNEVRKYEANVLENVGRDGEMLSLTDLWRAAGSPSGKEPAQWLRQDATTQLIETVSEILNMCQTHIIKSRRGKSGGSYAHKNIALDYAKYLDPALHVLVNEVFFQRLEEEKNPELIGKRYIEAYKKRGKSREWIAARLQGIDTRNAFTETLKSHNVTGKGYGRCTDAIYKPLYGCNAKGIRVKKALPAKGSLRDNMSRTELIAVQLAESLASDTIEKRNVRGNRPCERESLIASQSVAVGLMDYKNRLDNRIY